MHDSRARRVSDVTVPARRTSPLRGLALVGAAALSVLAVVVAVNTLRGPQVTSAAAPSTSALPATSPGTTALPGATTSPGAAATSQPSASPAGNVRPDGRHGFLSQTGPERTVLRTEQDATPLAQIATGSGGAVSPDGHRLAMLRGERGQQFVWGDAIRFADAKVAVDLSGSGESFVGNAVWAADNSNSIAFAVIKPSTQQGVDTPPLYSALRSVDLATGAVRELARTNNGRILVPLIWRPRDNLAVSFETGPGGYAYSYVIVRTGQVNRTEFDRDQPPLGLLADRDGARVLGLFGTGNDLVLKWWAWDRPEQAQEMRPPSGETFLRAVWRAGAEEIGVELVVTPTRTPVRGRFELWSVATNSRRVVIASGGFEMFRHDGTAAIGLRGFAAPFEMYLIDLATGATTPIPSQSGNERPLPTALLF